VEEEEYTRPLGEAKIVQEGDDVTLIGWGAMMPIIREGVKDSDYDVEVIDLRTVSPMDTETVIESVKKTGRSIVVHEAPRTCGVGAEIVARINEKALLYLEAPVERVTGPDITIPLPQGENFYYISPEKIRRGIKRVMEF
jgi:pyruvate dehydrogenase E1 component beta subunit